MKNRLIIITGPTGVGKTDLSIEIARILDTEIISCDSRQFFRELKIGTAVPSDEQLKIVPHHFIRHISVCDYYNAFMFETDTLSLLEKLFKNHNSVLMTGGSGMYIDAVCNGIDDIPDVDMDLREGLIKRMNEEGLESLRFELKILDPESYNFIDLKNGQRILRALEVSLQTGKPYSSFRKETKKIRPFDIVKIALNRDRNELYRRIDLRVDQMFDSGLVDEASEVFSLKGTYALKTVGYRELFDYFDGKTSLSEAKDLIKRNSRRYAKRQISWLLRDKEYSWFHPDDFEGIQNFIVVTMK
ncbi:MAG: tRNA (adenosine(37)-N6)-dimethylallyltransferase MiaA [Bacteroidetes bacterium GWF2_38_335]|nr:MAG: tRNA (adenosine(37)-N6)-dimethylallyltransferase MiaA [Bacteroidetes bacterium GWF2_38_335]OFY78468.1 MAG: tRNA (adenosine(37)-N6)-dimethylallyltransferase MiaA [Bacteroidetes bacterium RIFOXYA12_FULL_38_20]HBS88415.1 tRNA (adenosine(37)-N6)-dimethylallyltransferase MiaA [Bacteroidales bacterium]